MAMELASHKITVNAYGPAILGTSMWTEVDKALGQIEGRRPGESLKHYSKSIALGRTSVPDDVTGLVSGFLVSEDSDYVTGQTMLVDGGIVLESLPSGGFELHPLGRVSISEWLHSRVNSLAYIEMELKPVITDIEISIAMANENIKEKQFTDACLATGSCHKVIVGWSGAEGRTAAVLGEDPATHDVLRNF